MKVVWFGQEVHHPVLRFLVSVWVSTLVVLGMLVMFAFIIVAMLTWWIWIPLDSILKRYGRRGFVIHHDDNKISLSFTPDAFRI